MAHPFSRSCLLTGEETRPYWRDVGTVDAFRRANIDLAEFISELDICSHDRPISTNTEITSSSKLIHDEKHRRGSAISSLVCGGCIVSGSEMRESLLFTGVRYNAHSRLERVVAVPQMIIDRNARLRGVAIDRCVTIPEWPDVGEDPELDGKRLRRARKGVCLIAQPMLDVMEE